MAGGLRRGSLGASSRLRRQLLTLTCWSRDWRGRLGAEIALALIVGVAAFAVAAAIGTPARFHVPVAVLGLVLLLCVLVVARFAGLATLAGRRAAGSEEARGVLADEQAALRRVATLVARQPSPTEVFAAVTEEAGRLLHLDSAHLVAYGPGASAEVVGAWSQSGTVAPVGTQVPLEGDNILVRVFRTQRPVRIDEYRAEDNLVSAYADAMGVRAAAGSPVVVAGRSWGVLAVASWGPEPLPAGTEPRIGAFSELVAMAIANAAARAEIERLAQEQAALRRVATLVAEGADTAEVFAAVARMVSEVMHLPVAAIQRYEDDGETMTVLAAWSDRAHPFQPGTSRRLHGSGLAARVRRTARAARAQDYANRRGSFAAVARELGLKNVAGAPIIVNGAVWGLMTIASTEAPLPDHAEDRLAEFTELLGTAIANTQSRAELSASRARIVTAADDARRQLERDLHDGIQQRLVSLALKARTIETMTPRPASEIQGELSVLADGLGTSLDELREVSRGIHPAVLSEAGLGPALRALARRSAVPVVLDLNLGARLAEHVEVAGYYITSEALTNAAKHAQASVIDLRVDGHDDALILSIHDDGIGGADPSRGSGIIGLKDRVEALGGHISVLSPAGRGTTLDVQLPAR